MIIRIFVTKDSLKVLYTHLARSLYTATNMTYASARNHIKGYENT